MPQSWFEFTDRLPRLPIEEGSVPVSLFPSTFSEPPSEIEANEAGKVPVN